MILAFKRKWILALGIFILVLVASPVHIDAADIQRVYDQADLLSDIEIAQLEEQIQALRNELTLDIVIVTTSDSGGKSTRAYADDFYDYNGFGTGSEYDGILLLIDMDNRETYISTTGAAIDYFTDSRIDSMLDGIVPHISNKEYAKAGMVFLDNVKRYVHLGIPKGQYREDESARAPNFNKSLARTPVYLLIACTLAGITVGIMIYNNRGRVQTNRTTYLDKNSMKLVNSHDLHVNTHISKVKINTSSGSGGKSSTHRSSSGRSHGGGGRGF